jgi:formamidopyrimidine-DNA glycosylase
MPELPDLTVYLEALERRILGVPLERVRIASPFVLRTTDPRRLGLAAFDFPNGSGTLTEASRTHRAGVWTARGRDAVRAYDRGGTEVLGADLSTFGATLRRERHTLKRALTDHSLSRLLRGDWPQSIEEWEDVVWERVRAA